MSHALLLLFRLVHVIVGVLWVGSVVFIAVFLLPSLRAAGPGGSAVMYQLMEVRKLSNYLFGGAVVTILSGLTLYWNDSAGFSSAWLGSGPGRTFGLGAVLGIITAAIGATVNAPCGKKIGLLVTAIRVSGGPPSPEQSAEIQRLQARLTTATRVAAALLILATAAMAVARYVPS